VTVIDELAKLKEDLAVATLHKPNLLGIYDQMETDLSRVKIFHKSTPLGLGRSGIFSYYRFYSVILNAFRNFKPDQTLFFDDVIDPQNKIHGKIVLYSHFPFALRIRYFDNQRHRLRNRVYENLFKRSEEAEVILANSSTTSEYIKIAWGRDAKIVYPPVDTTKFRPHEKKNIVAMLGRFCPYKNMEDGIKAVALSKTKPELYIIGFKDSNAYLQKLRVLAKKYKIEKRTKILANASSECIRKVLGVAKIFIHPCKNEPFGIAIVEGMASGCVPVVYKAWGPWLDIIEKGRYGIGFETVSEIAEKIDEISSDEAKFKRFSEIARRRAEYFNEEKFRKKIGGILCTF
jgi:glycosyltransferase involved in cell wall biosynthesis